MAQFSLDNLDGVVLTVEYDPAAEWLSITANREDGTEHAAAGLHLVAPE